MGEEKEEKRVSYLEVLKNKNFALYTFADISTIFGTTSSSMAFILIAFGDMGSILNVGYYQIFTMIPTLTLALVVGVYVDRWGKKKSYIISSLLSALIILIPIFYQDLVTIIAVAFVLAILAKFRHASHQGILPSILDKEELQTANSIERMATTAPGVIAPTLAVLIIGWYGFWILFVVDSITYIIDLVCLYYIPVEENLSQKKTEGVKGVIEDIKSSFGHVKEKPTILFIMVTGTLLLLLVDGFGLFTLEISHVTFNSELPYGYYKSAGYMGAFAGGFISGKFLQNTGLKYIVFATFILSAISFLGLSLFTFILSFAVFGIIRGIGSALIGIAIDTSIQTYSEEEFLGRISSLELVMLRGTGIIATVVAVILIRTIGPFSAMVYIGSLLLVVGFAVYLFSDRLLS